MKEQKHSQCFPKLEFLKRIWSLNSLISLIRNGFSYGNLFGYKFIMNSTWMMHKVMVFVIQELYQKVPLYGAH